jgi:integrase
MARFTQAWIEKQKPKAARYIVRVPEVSGLYLRVTPKPKGTKTFTVVARSPRGEKKPRWAEVMIEERKGQPRVPVVIGSHTPEQIADAARAAIRRIKSIPITEPVFPAPEPEPASLEKTAEAWIEQDVRARGLRSGAEIERRLRTLVFPSLGRRVFVEIKRRDVAELLDVIVRDNGARTANLVLADLRSLMNWYAKRSDDYSSPIIRGMARPVPEGAKPKQGPVSTAGKRERKFTDDEVRLLWRTFGECGVFGGVMKLAVLSAQRVGKIAPMRWTDVAIDGAWNIPRERREKNSPETLLLPEMARDVIRSQPRIAGPYIFAGRPRKRPKDGEAVDAAELARHFNGFASCKKALDEKLLKALQEKHGKKAELQPWVVHDLRSLARSLMARAGVDDRVAERALGHKVGNRVEQVYNRHTYDREIAEALQALEQQLRRILDPPSKDNVVDLRQPEAVA